MKLVTPLRLGLIGTVSLLIGMGLDAIWWKHNRPIPVLSDNSGSPGAILASRIGCLAGRCFVILGVDDLGYKKDQKAHEVAEMILGSGSFSIILENNRACSSGG